MLGFAMSLLFKVYQATCWRIFAIENFKAVVFSAEGNITLWFYVFGSEINKKC
jgi:hypothetical protein